LRTTGAVGTGEAPARWRGFGEVPASASEGERESVGSESELEKGERREVLDFYRERGGEGERGAPVLGTCSQMLWIKNKAT
jgi:hypothetical protein